MALARRISRLVVVGVLILAALLAPIALPVRMYVEWVRRRKVAIEQVAELRDPSLLTPTDRSTPS